jgi:hypothetical protein
MMVMPASKRSEEHCCSSRGLHRFQWIPAALASIGLLVYLRFRLKNNVCQSPILEPVYKPSILRNEFVNAYTDDSVREIVETKCRNETLSLCSASPPECGKHVDRAFFSFLSSKFHHSNNHSDCVLKLPLLQFPDEGSTSSNSTIPDDALGVTVVVSHVIEALYQFTIHHLWNNNANYFVDCHLDDCDAMHHLIMTIFSSLVDYLVIGGGHAAGPEIHVELHAYSERTSPSLTVSLQSTSCKNNQHHAFELLNTVVQKYLHVLSPQDVASTFVSPEMHAMDTEALAKFYNEEYLGFFRAHLLLDVFTSTRIMKDQAFSHYNNNQKPLHSSPEYAKHHTTTGGVVMDAEVNACLWYYYTHDSLLARACPWAMNDATFRLEELQRLQVSTTENPATLFSTAARSSTMIATQVPGCWWSSIGEWYFGVSMGLLVGMFGILVLSKVKEYHHTQQQVANVSTTVEEEEEQDKAEASSMDTTNMGDLSLRYPTVTTKEQRLVQVQLCLWLDLGVTTSLWIYSALESGGSVFLDTLVASLGMLVLISLIFGRPDNNIDHNKEEGEFPPATSN